ncbi:MAG: hypothetical protein M1836_004968 [Candelina mexicana]|nr:MAG: hypothetical protein M1836_004968 [Candelina mexicana]
MAVTDFFTDIGVVQLLVIALAALSARAFYLRYLHPLSRYPGPFLASQTDFWKLIAYARGKQHTVDYTLHEVYGPIVRDGPNSLRFSDLEAFKAIYGFKNFEKTDYYVLAGAPERRKFALFQLRGEEQHRIRRKQIVFPSFSAKAIASYEPVIARNLSLWLEKLGDDVPLGGGNLNIAPRIRYMPMDTGTNTTLVTEIAHGNSMGFVAANRDLHGVIAEKERMTRSVNIYAQVHWLGRLLGSKLLWPKVTKPRIDEQGQILGLGAIFDVSRASNFSIETKALTGVSPQFSRKAFYAALGEGAKSLPHSVLKGFVETPPDAARAWGNEQKLEDLGSLVMGGTGSTTAGSCACLYHLGTHPSWQQAILSEITPLLTSDPTNTPPSLPFSALSKSASLRAVIKESLRMTPPFVSVFERQVGKGVEAAIPGLVAPLPLGTRVGCNHYVITRSKAVFGEDADEFKPERWLIEDDAKLRQMEDGWAVFGRGARVCIAKDIALMFLTKAVAAMVLKWEFEVKEGSMKSVNGIDMQVRELPISLKAR